MRQCLFRYLVIKNDKSAEKPIFSKKMEGEARCELLEREQWEGDIWSMSENKTLDKYSSVINTVVRGGIVGMHAAELSQARRDIATSKAQASTPICCSFWNCVLSHYKKKKKVDYIHSQKHN